MKFGFPCNVSAKAKASDFKFGTQLGFVKANHKITPREKSGLGLGKLPKFGGVPFNIYAMAEAGDFKFGTQLGFAKAHHKIPHRIKSGRSLSSQIFGVPPVSYTHLTLPTKRIV